jgi:hypothetical protein
MRIALQLIIFSIFCRKILPKWQKVKMNLSKIHFQKQRFFNNDDVAKKNLVLNLF